MECPKKDRCKNFKPECNDMRAFNDTYYCFESKEINLYELRLKQSRQRYQKRKRVHNDLQP